MIPFNYGMSILGILVLIAIAYLIYDYLKDRRKNDKNANVGDNR